MEFFRIRRDIPFMRHALVFNVISLLTFLAAVFFLATRGLHFSVEFTGGTVMEVSYPQPADVETDPRARSTALGFADVQVQNFGTSRDVLIRLPRARRASVRAREAVASRCMAELLEGRDAGASSCSACEFVGPQVGKELADDGAQALALRGRSAS